MATIQIKASRRLGLDRSEFDVVPLEGHVVERELFQFMERGSLWEYAVLEVIEQKDYLTLRCANWIPDHGAFVGMTTTTRPLKAIERKRYAKTLPA